MNTRGEPLGDAHRRTDRRVLSPLMLWAVLASRERLSVRVTGAVSV